jgi:hypothetical protein
MGNLPFLTVTFLTDIKATTRLPKRLDAVYRDVSVTFCF